MKAYLIDPVLRTITAVEHDGRLDSIYRLLQCTTIDAVRIDEVDTIYVDDEGLLKDDIDSRGWFVWRGPHQPLCGRGLVTGTDADGMDTPPRIAIDEVRRNIVFLARTPIGLIEVPVNVHIRINGKPACERPADPMALMEASHAQHVGLMCSFTDRAEAERAAALYRQHYAAVEIVDGGCPAPGYDPT